jgi:hypothetical protein
MTAGRNQNGDPWEERTGILNIPTRLIRWFSGVFSAVWLILTAITIYHSFTGHAGQSWDTQTVGIITASAPNIGFALPTAYVLTEAIDMVFGAWYRQRTRERAQEEGRREGREEGRQAGIQERQERWLQWLERWRQAEANGQSFDEPPPGLNGEYPTQE